MISHLHTPNNRTVTGGATRKNLHFLPRSLLLEAHAADRPGRGGRHDHCHIRAHLLHPSRELRHAALHLLLPRARRGRPLMAGPPASLLSSFLTFIAIHTVYLYFLDWNFFCLLLRCTQLVRLLSLPPLFLSVHLFNVGFSGSFSASNIIDWCLLVKLISVQASIWKGVKEPQLQKFLFSVALFINLPVLLLQWLLRDGHSITINFIGPGICLAAHWR